MRQPRILFSIWSFAETYAGRLEEYCPLSSLLNFFTSYLLRAKNSPLLAELPNISHHPWLHILVLYWRPAHKESQRANLT